MQINSNSIFSVLKNVQIRKYFGLKTIEKKKNEKKNQLSVVGPYFCGPRRRAFRRDGMVHALGVL
jgi:hypothetical protein